MALAGLAGGISVAMLRFLIRALDGRKRRAAEDGRALDDSDIIDAVREGTLLRVRPILMTVATIVVGLIPIMIGSGTGSEVMRRIAAPMVGGVVSATLLTLIVLPAVFLLKARWQLRRQVRSVAPSVAVDARKV